MSSIPYGGCVVQVGQLSIVPVFDGTSREDPTHFYVTHPGMNPAPGHRREDWEKHRDLLDPDGRLEHAVGGFLVRSGDHLVLIDAGVGPGQIGPYGPYHRVIRGGELPARLRELGVDPADVTDVVLNLLRFFKDESCGQCTPCRVGCDKAVALLERKNWDGSLLNELAQAMRDASICGLGQAAPNAFITAMELFPGERARTGGG